MPVSFPKNSIVFRFIRDNSNSDKTDDVATITYAGKNTYNLSFRSPHSEVPTKKIVMSLDDKQAFRWVRRMMALLECDVDPFTSVQVDMPMMPSVLLKVENFARDYSSLLDAVEFQLDNWGSTVWSSADTKKSDPVPTRSENMFMTPPRVNRHHLFFDEE